jgi:hypothetical protein
VLLEEGFKESISKLSHSAISLLIRVRSDISLTQDETRMMTRSQIQARFQDTVNGIY